MIDRRTFINSITLGLLAAPFAAEAQQAERVRRIGILSPGAVSESVSEPMMAALRERGWSIGQNLHVKTHYTRGDPSAPKRSHGSSSRSLWT